MYHDLLEYIERMQKTIKENPHVRNQNEDTQKESSQKRPSIESSEIAKKLLGEEQRLKLVVKQTEEFDLKEPEIILAIQR